MATGKSGVDRQSPTTAQRKLLLHHRMYPGDAALNITVAYRIRGRVDLARLRAALQRIVDASVALNTTFDSVDGRDVAVRHAGGAHVRLRAAPAADGPDTEAAAVARWAGRQADKPLPPQKWPLYQVTVLRGKYAGYVCVVCSHLVSDAYTMFNLGRMTSQVYSGTCAWAQLADQLGDDPVTLAAPASPDAAIAHLRDSLSGVERLSHQALEHRRRADGALPGRHEQRWLPADVVTALHQSDLGGRGPYAAFLSAYAVVLSALTGEPDVVVGVPLAGRRHQRQRTALGYFVNTLPVVLSVDRRDSFGDLCVNAARQVTALLRYQDFDLAEHAAAVFAGRPAFPVAVDNTATYYHDRFPLSLPGCAVEPLPVPRSLVRHPFGMHVQAVGDGYLVGMEYLDRLAPAEPLSCLEHVLRTGLAEPARRPRDIGVVDPDRDAGIDRLLNRRPTPELAPIAVAPAAPASLDAWFARSAGRYPDRVAVSDEWGAWTYAQLDDAAERVAAALAAPAATGAAPSATSAASAATGAAPGGQRYVAVAMRPRRELIAVLLGALRAGRAYVPLDPRAPRERARHILGQFDDLTLVADPDVLPDVPVARRLDPAGMLGAAPSGAPATAPTGGHAAVSTGGPATAPATAPTTAPTTAPPRPQVRSGDPAYVIFTSGSTGVPKGVEVTHGNVLRLFTTTEHHFDFGPDDVWCLFHAASFDFSVWEIFGALLYGGRLVVPPEPAIRSPERFARLLAEERVTVLNQTPSAFRRLTGVLDPELAGRYAVRWVVFGGEALSFEVLRGWLDLVGRRARLVNMYGITETTVHTTFHEIDPRRVPAERESVIGAPLPDLRLAVVDRNLNRCPVGVPGELLVAGPGVTRGYLGRPDLTAERFLRGTRYGDVVYRTGDRVYLRPDGDLVYLDRMDRQVQLRGYRIELGEVERALLAVTGVSGAHVALHRPASGEPYLVAWIVAAGGPSDAGIREALRERLPAYMRPTALLPVAEIPLTSNGKVDRAALPAPAGPATASPGPAVDGDVLAAVMRIWTETVHCGAVAPDDNFFEIGGTSMHVTEIHRRLVGELFAADLTMAELFEHPTPRQLAARIERGAAVAAPRPTGSRRVAPRAAARRHNGYARVGADRHDEAEVIGNGR